MRRVIQQNFGTEFAEKIIAWIKENSDEFEPEDFFSDADLDRWAEANGFIKPSPDKGGAA